MNKLGMLLGSSARTEILRVLAYQPEPIGLRHLARLAGVHPHSAEVALVSLVREKLVKRSRQRKRPLYRLAQGQPDVSVLRAVFRAAEREITRARSRALEKRARSILPFIREATMMFANAGKISDAT